MTELKEWQDKLNLCGRCGNCQQVCPLYQVEKSELAVARGKLHLLSLLVEDRIAATPRLKDLLDFCLQCGRCADLCQNGVPADKLIALGRSTINQALGGDFKNYLIRLLLGKDKLDASARAFAVLEKVGLKKAFKFAGIFSSKCTGYFRLLPEVKGEPLRKRLPGWTSGRKGSPCVGYFIGCLNNYVSQEVSTATLNILRKTGATVVIPEQKCCGLPSWTNGELQVTEELVRFNVQAFQEAGVDYIVTDCASCGHALKELPEVFLGQEGAVFQAKVLDISEYMERFLAVDALQSLSTMVTYHEPCHLRYGQKIKQEPRKILRSIPGLQFKEMENSGCCGFAGTFALSYFDMSNKLAKQRAQAIKESGAGVVVTGCPACQLQLERGLGEDGQELEVLNLAQLVDRVLPG